MSSKPNTRKWNDVQTAIAATAIVTTLGLWNLVATPAKTETVQTQEPVVPPTEPPVAAAPTLMPQVKIMFTQAAPQTTLVQQTQTVKKKKKNNQASTNGGGTVTKTKSS
jgi:hypothetical protein